jgi:hypothetical protein
MRIASSPHATASARLHPRTDSWDAPCVPAGLRRLPALGTAVALAAVLTAYATADASSSGRVQPSFEEKPETPESRIPPATGSSNDYLRDTDPALLRARQILGEFNTWFAERLPELYAAGYVGGANDDVRMTTTLQWAGKSPLQEVARAEGARRGITVVIAPVRFSDAELRAGQERIWAAQDRFADVGFAVHSVAGTCLAHDGLVVGGQFVDGAADPARFAAVEELARAVTPEVVGVEDTPPPVPLGADAAVPRR